MTAHRRGTKVRQRGWHGYVYKVNAIVWDEHLGEVQQVRQRGWHGYIIYKVNAIV